MAINERDFYASHGISFDVEEMQIEYTKRVINQAKIEVLTELQLEIEEKYYNCDICDYYEDENDISGFNPVGSIMDITDLIQEKINDLRGE